MESDIPGVVWSLDIKRFKRMFWIQKAFEDGHRWMHKDRSENRTYVYFAFNKNCDRTDPRNVIYDLILGKWRFLTASYK